MENTQTPMTKRQNTEQERGREAWSNIKAIKDLKDKDLEKKYRSLARGLNAMIQTNGLGATLGFFAAKSQSKEEKSGKLKKTEHYYLLEHLTKWMQKHFATSNIKPLENRNDDSRNDNYKRLLLWLIDEDTTSTDYRRATTECLSFGTWLSRFAEAELEGEEKRMGAEKSGEAS